MDMMRRVSLLALLLCAVLSLPAFALEKQFDTGFLATWWGNDNDDTGTQLAIPIRAGIVNGDLNAQLLNAFVYTSVDPDIGSSESLSSFVDTKLNISYALKGRAPVDVLMGLGLNLPTGYTDFKTEELVLVSLPPELLPISTFGEGFNVNPYLGIAKEWQQTALGLGMGYLWRGDYDYSETLQDFDPGDVFTITAEGVYDFTDACRGKIFAEYADYGTDTLDGEDYYQDGSLMLIGIGAAYVLPSSRIDGSITGISRSKAEYFTETGTPIDKEKNYGDELHIDLMHTCFLDSTTALRSHVNFLSMGENDYEKDSPFYNGGRMKFSLGGGMEKDLSGALKGNADLSLFTIKDRENWFHPGEDYSYRGFILSAGLQMIF
ncbi:MAG: hypothetical protein MUD15_07260 [Desulfobacterota bacterium]|nr:hypothetical protein [Thermodesulfobacteriota bacterium]